MSIKEKEENYDLLYNLHFLLSMTFVRSYKKYEVLWFVLYN